MARIASWNVNSIKARLPNVLQWLRDSGPEVVCLQEIKCVTEGFPCLEFEDLGYTVVAHGQKTYNGVAILAKGGIEDVRRGLPGSDGGDEEQARYLEGVVRLDGRMVRVASIYLPNGNPTDTPKYPYKLAWMERLRAHACDLLAGEEPVVLAGDYNVIPAPADVYDPESWREDALFRIETRRKFREILHLGYTDAFRALHEEPGHYTFWDYQAGAWQRNHGLRIDHLLLSPQAADLLSGCEIDKEPRAQPKASDHTPIWCALGA